MKLDSSSLKPFVRMFRHIAEQVFELPYDQEYYDQQMLKNTKTSFDKKTMDKVRQLRTTTDDSITLPKGRINPFIEGSN